MSQQLREELLIDSDSVRLDKLSCRDQNDFTFTHVFPLLPASNLELRKILLLTAQLMLN